MSEAPQARRRIYPLVLGIAAFETAFYVYFLRMYWFTPHDPATRSSDIVTGLVISFLFCVTTIPASILAVLRVKRRATLLFALAFPPAIILVFAVSFALFGRL